ncbi:hypothetical protein RFI_36987, partial [Reticulomyxa filosa]
KLACHCDCARKDDQEEKVIITDAITSQIDVQEKNWKVSEESLVLYILYIYIYICILLIKMKFKKKKRLHELCKEIQVNGLIQTYKYNGCNYIGVFLAKSLSLWMSQCQIVDSRFDAYVMGAMLLRYGIICHVPLARSNPNVHSKLVADIEQSYSFGAHSINSKKSDIKKPSRFWKSLLKISQPVSSVSNIHSFHNISDIRIGSSHNNSRNQRLIFVEFYFYFYFYFYFLLYISFFLLSSQLLLREEEKKKGAPKKKKKKKGTFM